MKNRLVIIAASVAFLTLAPVATFAATPAAAHLGQILIDTDHHGEAWYVNPASYMRVYLGRPDQALARFDERASYVTYDNISRVAEADGQKTDATYAAAVAGTVLAPEDVIGASWYVDPVLKLRHRLATPEDAWNVMRAGTPVRATLLAAIPIEPSDYGARTTVATVKSVDAGDSFTLTDGTHVRLLSIDVPSNPDIQAAAIALLKEKIGTKPVTLVRDIDYRTIDGFLPRHVLVGDSNLAYELVRNGLAFDAISFPNYEYAEQLIVGQIDAARLKRGFWQNASNQ